MSDSERTAETVEQASAIVTELRDKWIAGPTLLLSRGFVARPTLNGH